MLAAITGNSAGALTALFGLASNGFLAAGAFWVARNGLRQPPGLPLGLATALVFWTAATVGLEILSAVATIAPFPILVWACTLAAAALCVAWLRPRPGYAPSVEPTTPLAWDARIAVALVLFAAIGLLMRSLLLGVKVVSDGPIYHLYFAARWWQAGHLTRIAAPFGENAATYFPANGDLWFTWLIASWGGDQLAKVGQTPFLALAAIAALASARLLGATRPSSVIAACWFASSTPFLLFSFEPNVDTIFVAAYLVAVYFLLRFALGHDGTPALLLCGLAAGQALGTKAVGVVFVPPLIVVALGAIVGRYHFARARAFGCLALLSAVLVSAGYWYLGNAILTGNPLYPLELRLMGHTVLSGWYGPDAMRSSPYYLPIEDWRALADILMAVLDPRLVPVWLLALATGWMGHRPPAATTSRSVGLITALAVANVALYWILIPYRTQQRFMLQAVGLAVVPLAITLDRARWLRALATCLLALHLLTAQDWPFGGGDASIPWDLSRAIPNAVGPPSSVLYQLQQAIDERPAARSVVHLSALVAIAPAALILVWALTRGKASRRGAPRAWGARAVACVVFAALAFLEARWGGTDPRLGFFPPFPDFFRGWIALDSRSGPAGARVAYAGTNIPYYLLCPRLRNHVRYINVDRHANWLLHDYHKAALARGEGSWPNSRPGWDRARPDYDAWLGNLAAAGIELLVVTRVNPAEGPHNVFDRDNFPIERTWADAHPERFEPLYGARERDPWFRLYRVRPGASLPAPPVAAPAGLGV